MLAGRSKKMRKGNYPFRNRALYNLPYNFAIL